MYAGLIQKIANEAVTKVTAPRTAAQRFETAEDFAFLGPTPDERWNKLIHYGDVDEYGRQHVDVGRFIQDMTNPMVQRRMQDAIQSVVTGGTKPGEPIKAEVNITAPLDAFKGIAAEDFPRLGGDWKLRAPSKMRVPGATVREQYGNLFKGFSEFQARTDLTDAQKLAHLRRAAEGLPSEFKLFTEAQPGTAQQGFDREKARKELTTNWQHQVGPMRSYAENTDAAGKLDRMGFVMSEIKRNPGLAAAMISVIAGGLGMAFGGGGDATASGGQRRPPDEYERRMALQAMHGKQGWI